MKAMANNSLNMLGMATKAGKTVSGEFATQKAIKEGKAKLVIVAEDASDNTKKMFTDKCTYYNIPIFVKGTMDELGRMTGHEKRASVAVTDNGFKDILINKLKDTIGDVSE